ncbi:uncharacterized protein LOC124170482 [Ischnura elegans]|uniref:uncharacterized protein LOC124170482 n=1 Tax=Ischnura elegans TaxID=197161 RepID=UPI001ED86FAA|nr:uncharacterized protein LOC124170482 [Ischnura elegans]XP_046405183.1 uncharacterized protein LOC124170482 [Ischnura elegans]
MEVWQREALRRHRKEILDDLHVDYVLDHLISRHILSEDHYDNIFKEIGRRNRARLLLDLLPTLGPRAYEEFIASLKEPYSWLAEGLSEESAARKEESSSHPVNSDSMLNKLPNLDERTQLLENMATVVANCGKCLTETSKVILALAQNQPDHLKLPNTRVSRQNSINLAKNEIQMVGTSREEITMDRLRGGGDGDSESLMLDTEKAMVFLDAEKIEIPPSSLPLTDDLYAKTRHQEMRQVKKIMDSAYNYYGDTVDGVHHNGGIGGENSEDLLSNLVRNQVDGVTAFNGNVEQFKNSGSEDDSPDSGISGGEIIALEEGIGSLNILQQKNGDEGGEDFDSKCEVKANEDGSVRMLCGSMLNSGLCEMPSTLNAFEKTLQESVMDMIGAVRNLVQISGRESKFDDSIKN